MIVRYGFGDSGQEVITGIRGYVTMNIQRLCEECGDPIGPTFHIVEVSTGLFSEEAIREAVCLDCYEEGKDQWLSAEAYTESEESLKGIYEQIRAQSPQEQSGDFVFV